jgi:hypothetical protein
MVHFLFVFCNQQHCGKRHTPERCSKAPPGFEEVGAASRRATRFLAARQTQCRRQGSLNKGGKLSASVAGWGGWGCGEAVLDGNLMAAESAECVLWYSMHFFWVFHRRFAS